MTSDTQKTQRLTEFQVREAYATLLREYRELVDAAGRLRTFICAKDAALLESFYALGAVPAALGVPLPGTKSNGHAEFPPRRPDDALDALKGSRGETQHA